MPTRKPFDPEVELVQMITVVCIKCIELPYTVDAATRTKLDSAIDQLYEDQATIIKGYIDTNTEEFKKHAASLKEINKDLLKTIVKANKIAETLKNLGKFVEEVANIVGMVTAPSIPAFMAVAPLVTPIAIKERTAAKPAMELLEAESAETLIESSVEEKIAALPIEEVLYKVELTPAKLIITVDAGLNRPVEVVFRNKMDN